MPSYASRRLPGVSSQANCVMKRATSVTAWSPTRNDQKHTHTGSPLPDFFHIPPDLVVAKRPRMWRAACAVISCCYTTLGRASSPDVISNNFNNSNDLNFYH
jgi:hypothetical protein